MTILFFPSLLYHEDLRTPEDLNPLLVQFCQGAPFHPRMEQRIETTSDFTSYSHSNTFVTIDMTNNFAINICCRYISLIPFALSLLFRPSAHEDQVSPETKAEYMLTYVPINQ